MNRSSILTATAGLLLVANDANAQNQCEDRNFTPIEQCQYPECSDEQQDCYKVEKPEQEPKPQHMCALRREIILNVCA